MVVIVKGIILHEGKILIVQRAEDDEVGGGTWECVGGKVEFGEDLEPALVREIKEEVGLSAKVERILYATSFKTGPTRQVVILMYLCSCSEIEIKLSNEHMDYQWASKNEAKASLAPDIVKDFERNHVFLLKSWS